MAEPVLHVLLVDFHHRFGPVVQVAVPPLPTASAPPQAETDKSEGDQAATAASASPATSTDPKLLLPLPWAHLAFLALPDGLHNANGDDTTFFTLPALETTAADGSRTESLSDSQSDGQAELLQADAEQQADGEHQVPRQRVFGVAVARHVARSELKHADDAVTRNTVLKAVCVLMRRPVFHVARDALRSTTEVLFAQRDFSDTSLLQELHLSLTRSLSTKKPEALSECAYAGLNLRDLIIRLRHHVLVIFKLMLLEKKIVVCCTRGGVPAYDVAQAVLTLASLIPGCLSDLPVDVALRAQVAEMQGPLPVFRRMQNIFPYAALQQLDDLCAAPCALLGVTNRMLTTHPSLAHIVVDLGGPTGKVQLKFATPELKAAAALSTADVRFIDGVIDVVLNAPRAEGAALADEVDGYRGSSDWVRHEFTAYLLHAQACADRARGDPTQAHMRALAEFSMPWFNAWRTTRAYGAWCRRCDASRTLTGQRPSAQRAAAGWLDDPEAACAHVCAGAYQFGDISRRARQLSTAHLGPGVAEERARQVRSALQSSGKAISETMTESGRSLGKFFNSARSNFRSFWDSLEPGASEASPGAASGSLPMFHGSEAANALEATAEPSSFAIDDGEDDYEAAEADTARDAALGASAEPEVPDAPRSEPSHAT